VKERFFRENPDFVNESDSELSFYEG
jgi:hypothetical protein